MNYFLTALITFLLTAPSFAEDNCQKKWSNLFDLKEDLINESSYLINNCDNQLKEKLASIVKKDHRPLGYKSAKKHIFSRIDNHHGKVCSVYSNHCLSTNKIPNNNVMNIEHTWPKSKGAKTGPAKSDIHHLFPCNSRINSRRSSFPFCNVNKERWAKEGSRLGKGSGHGEICFEPPARHRGNVARAYFYFSIRYEMRINDREEKTLKQWNIDDPVDQMEKDRNEEVFKIQKNRNPFIDHPEFASLISNF